LPNRFLIHCFLYSLLIMNAYMLDFSRRARPRRPIRPTRWPRQRMYRTFRQIMPLLSTLLCSIALVGLLRQRAQTHTLRERVDAQTIQYDSLLAAKAEADRQLDQLRVRLLKYHHP